MIIERLRNETSVAHQSLEKLLIPRIKSITTPAQYLSLLQMFYGFYAPLEAAIDGHMEDHILPDYNERRKAGAILNDIYAITDNTDSVATLSEDLPQMENTGNAIGALYVLEGSTLGGQVIRKMLEKNLQLPGGKGLEFFNGYGEATPQRWKHFINCMNSYASTSGAGDAIIQGANDTFIKIKSWAEQH